MLPGVQGSNTRKPLGKILLKQKLVSEEELDEQLEKQRNKPGSDRIASTLAQSGKVADVHLLKALSEQLGVPAIDLAQVMIPLSNLALIPIEVARQQLILPILVKENEVHLAMADPGNKRVIEEIEFIAGKKVLPYVTLQHSIGEVIEYAYRIAAEGKEYYTGPFVARAGGSIQANTSTEIDWKLGILGAQSRLSAEMPAIASECNLALLTLPNEHEIVARLASDPGLVVLVEMSYLDDLGTLVLRKLREDNLDSALKRLILIGENIPWRMAFDVQQFLNIQHVISWPLHPSQLRRCVDQMMRASRGSDIDMAPPEVSQAIDISMRSFQRGDHEDAISGLVEALVMAPDSFDLHYNLGLLYGHQQRVSDAIRELTVALDIRPHDFSVLRNLAVLYQNQGFTRMALDYWEHALCYAPAHDLKSGLREHITSLLVTDDLS